MTRTGTTRWHYLRAWIKVDRRLPKTRGDYPDGAIAALTFAFCKAAEQPEPGTFETRAVLRAILDATGNRRGKWVAYLMEHGDLAEAKDGSVTLPNWRTFQEEGRSTERVQKHRETPEEPSRVGAHGDERRTPTEYEMKEPPIGGDSPAPEVVKLQKLAEELTGRAYVMANVHSAIAQKAITEQLDLHGFHAVEPVWRSVWQRHDGKVTLRQLVFEADDVLNAVHRPRAESPADQKARGVARLRALASGE
jgi:hypothetical protein